MAMRHHKIPTKCQHHWPQGKTLSNQILIWCHQTRTQSQEDAPNLMSQEWCITTTTMSIAAIRLPMLTMFIVIQSKDTMNNMADRGMIMVVMNMTMMVMIMITGTGTGMAMTMVTGCPERDQLL